MIARIAVVALALVLAGSTSCAQRDQDVVVRIDSPRTGWLGVSIEDMTERLAQRMNVKTKEGALVNSVEDESPAKKAGIREDDIIIEFNGTTVKGAQDLRSAVGRSEPGSTASLVVMRRGDRKTLKAEIARPPRAPYADALRSYSIRVPRVPRLAFTFGSSLYGLSLMDLNRQLAGYFAVPGSRGVLVTEVEEQSAAAKAGFQAGDVIVRAGNDDVDDADDLRWAVDGARAGDTLALSVIRRGSALTLPLLVEEEEEYHMHRFRSGTDFPHEELDIELPREMLRHKEEAGRLKDELQVLKEEMGRIGREIGDAVREARQKLHRELRWVNL